MFLVRVVLLLKILWVGQVFQQESPVEERIWNGWQLESVTEFPFYAALIHPYQWVNGTPGSVQPHCGGTIIYDRWVVTAASCVDGHEHEYETTRDTDERISKWKVIVGVISLKQDFRNNQTLKDAHVKDVKEVLIYPQYKMQETGYQNDLALFFLRHRLTFVVGVVSKMPLPSVYHRYVNEGEIKYIFGFGLNSAEDEWSGRARAAAVKVKNETWCKSAFTFRGYNEKVNDTVAMFNVSVQLCADGYSDHVCSQDFGAGLVGHEGLKFSDMIDHPPTTGNLLGILSWTPLFSGCGLALPSVYTRLTEALIYWILHVYKEFDSS